MSIDINSISSGNLIVFPSSNRNTVDSRLLTEERISRMIAGSPMKAWVIDGQAIGNSSSPNGYVEFVLDGHYYKAKGLALGDAPNEDYIYARIQLNHTNGSELYDFVTGGDDEHGNYSGLTIFSNSALIPMDDATNMNSVDNNRTMLLFEKGAGHPLAQPTYVLDCGTI